MLGPIEIARAGRPAETLPGRLRRTLLAVLLARAGRPVPVDALADALWPDGREPRTEQRLQLHVHRLRRTLGEPDRLAHLPEGYLLRVAPGELDAERFESLVAGTVRDAGHDPGRTVAALRDALGLWRGTPFSGLDVPDLADWAHRLTECRMTAIETLAEAELARGRAAAVVGELSDLVRAHPLRERLHALLMTALHRSGRRSDALAAYRTARKVLVAELGLEPGPELRALEAHILTGRGAGAADTAGSGTVTPGRPPTPPPAQLPMDVRGFTGREAELAELDGLLSAEVPAVITAVAGTAGVGKTALAVRWAHRVRERFPDGQLYVDLRGYGPDHPVTPQDALAEFLRALGVDGAAVPPGLDERAARFRTLLDRRRMLIVLDNARTAEQVRPLLPGSPSCFALVTSRDSLAGLVAREGAQRIGLDLLPLRDARGLLHALLGDRVSREPEATDTLIERCARLPLALRIAAELIRSQPARGIAELADELARQRDALDVLDVGDDARAAVRAVFSWSYRQLDPAVARVFRLLGLHPGHDTDARAVAALAGTGPREAGRALDALLRAHLVGASAGGRYQPHDLLRAYAAELAAGTDSAAGRGAALERLSDHYLRAASAAMDVVAPDDYVPRPEVGGPDGTTPAFPAYEQAFHWLDTERANLLEVARHGDGTFVHRLAQTIWRYLDIGGHHDEAAALHTRALEAARRLGDPLGEAHARRALGLAMSRMGRNGEVIGHLTWALAAYRRAGERDLDAATLGLLANVHSKRGDLHEAGRHYARVLELNSRSGNWQLTAVSSTNLARNLLSLGRPDEALRHLDTAVALSRDHASKPLECNALCVLAEVLAHMGRLDDALGHARRSLALARETGYRSSVGDSLRVLGMIHRALGDDERAVRHHDEALAIVREIDDTLSIAKTLNGFAAAHAAAGRPADALRRYDEAREVAEAAEHRVQLAHAHAGIAETHAVLGDDTPARTHGRRAARLYEELGLPDRAARLRARLDSSP
ncbi:BTAD domain-containing putative transcriptional regulator [Streptomyces sp. RFCAC02]|uniref:AfsR/SARP family transcriptional regulator n=1 Tax=Streptomyces sp. RFCAC02 TaxID=2499143 RepID=UPI00143CD9CE|nr:BTAD domain-containing putative transcriptional regulator [Streptomyces sp. RFCAC02]